jgi:hypothetical protein
MTRLSLFLSLSLCLSLSLSHRHTHSFSPYPKATYKSFQANQHPNLIVVGLQLLVGDLGRVRNELRVGRGKGLVVDAEDVFKRFRPQRIIRRRKDEEGLEEEKEVVFEDGDGIVGNRECFGI